MYVYRNTVKINYERKKKKTQSIITEKIRKLINVMLLQYKITRRKNINIRAGNTVP